MDVLLPVRIDGKTGYINARGQVVIDFEFEHGDEFCDGLARILAGNKRGFIDTKGNIVIPPVFDSALDFSEGFAVVTVKNKQGYIDKTGNIVIEPRFYSANNFKDGIARVNKIVTSTGAFIDTSGKIILANSNFLISTFNEGLINCPGEKGWGFMDINGVFKIEPIYDHTYPFYEGKAAVVPKKGLNGKPNRSERFGFINKAGEMIIPPLFKGVLTRFSEGLCAVWDKRYGYIDATGELVIPYDFDMGDHFSEGLAAFEPKGKNEKYGYIDTKGIVVIPPVFYHADAFKNGIAEVMMKDKKDELLYGYINKKGDYIWEPSK